MYITLHVSKIMCIYVHNTSNLSGGIKWVKIYLKCACIIMYKKEFHCNPSTVCVEITFFYYIHISKRVHATSKTT